MRFQNLIKPKKFHKTQVTIPLFFHVDLLLSHVQGVHPANILQASRKDVASIHTSLASCKYYDWSVLAASILHARFVSKIRMRKHSMRTNVRLQYACCTFAACMLRTRSTQAASFFSCARHVRHFHKGQHCCHQPTWLLWHYFTTSATQFLLHVLYLVEIKIWRINGGYPNNVIITI